MGLHLVQIQHKQQGARCVARVDGNVLSPVRGFTSIYDAAMYAVVHRESLPAVIRDDSTADVLEYESVWSGDSHWQLLPAFDHPTEAARCLVSGTGLTHRRSMQTRHEMHASDSSGQTTAVTDSQRVYEWGVAGGKPMPGQIGVQPEWYYKGCGTILRAHGQSLNVPAFADDGGEEAEVIGAYVIGPDGQVFRVGFAAGNEFSDHIMERKNYAYLAPSKLRQCAIGPELVCGLEFEDLTGTVEVRRDGRPIWSAELASGQRHMVHSLANLEHHHFKHAAHRRPGDAHIHFFGAGAFSFGQGITLLHGDEMAVHFEKLGRALVNPAHVDHGPAALVAVRDMGKEQPRA